MTFRWPWAQPEQLPLDIGPDDRLVLEWSRPLSQEQAKQIAERVRQAQEEGKHLFLDHGIKVVAVIRAPEDPS